MIYCFYNGLCIFYELSNVLLVCHTDMHRNTRSYLAVTTNHMHKEQKEKRLFTFCIYLTAE